LSPPSKLWAGGIYIGGSHPASWGGAYQMILYGFSGLTIEKGKPKLNPHLPSTWKRLNYKCIICGKKYQIEITQSSHTIKEC